MIKDPNYLQGEISNLQSYITLNIVRIKDVDLLLIFIFLIYFIYIANWSLIKKIDTHDTKNIDRFCF